MKSFQDIHRSSELALSSDSDGEGHDGLKSLLRKVSTQRQLNHGVSATSITALLKSETIYVFTQGMQIQMCFQYILRFLLFDNS